MSETSTLPHGVEAGAWPPWRTGPFLLCVFLGTGVGAFLGAIAAVSIVLIDALIGHGYATEAHPISPFELLLGSYPFALIGAMVGSVCGLFLSPILWHQSSRPHFFGRLAVATLLGGIVACVSGNCVWLGSIPLVALALITSLSQAGHLFSGKPSGSDVGLVLAGPALSLLAVGAWAFANRLPDDEAQLIELLGDSSGERSGAAVRKLREVGGLEPFLKAMEDADARVRERAVRSAGAFESSDAVPALLRATEDANQRVRIAALGALFHMGTEQPLLEALGSSDEGTTLSLCNRVGWCGDSSHIPALEVLLDHPVESVREEAAKTIEHLRTKASAH